MSLDATTASSIARSQPERSSDFAKCMSFPYCSFILSALFNLFFLLYTLVAASSLCILIYQHANNPPLSTTDLTLLGALVVALVIDVLYFSLRLHNRAKSPYSAITYTAYFREKPASVLRLWGKSSHHRRLYFRWHAALRWMVPLDVVALFLCVLPVHVNAQPMQLYDAQPVGHVIDVYHQALTMLATMLEIVVGMECVLELCRRCCGPEYPNVLLWHPETGNLTPVHPHEYHERMVHQQQQSTPPHTNRAVNSFAPSDDHPVYAPPAYGHQDMEDAYMLPPHPNMPPQHQYAHQQPQQQRQPPYMPQQQPYMQPPTQYMQPLQQPYARLQRQQVGEDEEQVEGQPREGKANGKDEKVGRQNEGKTGDDEEDGEEGGEGGELGAATAPLVMMMSPALMDEDNAVAASRPRVMLRVRPSDADRAEERTPRQQALSPPRYAVVHMSST